jgi:hypothetical protein
MFYHPQTNQYISEYRDSGFTLGENQYPAGWLNVSTPQDKEAAGLLEVITEGEYKDDKYFYNTEELVGNIRRIVNIPKTSEQINQANQQEIADFLAKVREARELILNRLAGIAISAFLTNNTVLTSAYITARQSLLDITKDIPADLEGIKATVIARYQYLAFTAVTSAPALEIAFNSLDL